MDDRLEEIKKSVGSWPIGAYSSGGDVEWLITEVEKLRAWLKSSLETITVLTDALVAKNQETK
jgi:urease accessory protein UreF